MSPVLITLMRQTLGFALDFKSLKIVQIITELICTLMTNGWAVHPLWEFLHNYTLHGVLPLLSHDSEITSCTLTTDT
jgi:hypothetical protein